MAYQYWMDRADKFKGELTEATGRLTSIAVLATLRREGKITDAAFIEAAEALALGRIPEGENP